MLIAYGMYMQECQISAWLMLYNMLCNWGFQIMELFICFLNYFILYRGKKNISKEKEGDRFLRFGLWGQTCNQKNFRPSSLSFFGRFSIVSTFKRNLFATTTPLRLATNIFGEISDFRKNKYCNSLTKTQK
jgi:hypothetical protein